MAESANTHTSTAHERGGKSWFSDRFNEAESLSPLEPPRMTAAVSKPYQILSSEFLQKELKLTKEPIVNQGGFVNLLDIQPFVELINSGGHQIEADINQDGVVTCWM
jgi:hypothetical protein